MARVEQTVNPAALPFTEKASVVVKASQQYSAGPLKTWLLGHNYRREWEQPVQVPVLNLSTAQGGLRP
ncbi:hypothetical protein [Hymenobacter sp. 5414T-23]|nr:hypothetical protein [Hymenobacter sp. 5414T-23]UOQ81504.1 hypothetical protein MUN83_01510 [Hymenobacter sp. 5414T-23]